MPTYLTDALAERIKSTARRLPTLSTEVLVVVRGAFRREAKR